MALKIGSTTVVTNTPNVAWSFITGVTANLVQTVTINGTGTTETYCYSLQSGSLIFTRN